MMSTVASWPVAVTALAPVSVGTVRWFVGPHLNVTILVKGVFEMVPEQPMVFAAAEAISVSEQTSGGPAASLVAVRESVPMLPATDVVLFGHAYAQQAATIDRVVRLALLRDEQLLVDKSVRVVGDCSPGGEPAPFDRIPMIYERAVGGLGSPANPLGVGWRGTDDQAPNLLSLTDPEGTVACMGPIPAGFAVRRQLLAGASRQALEQDGARLPDDFDWGFLQCAPVDQRVPSLRGDEWLELDGLTDRWPRLRTRLPAARGWARVYGGERFAIPSEVPLQADLVQICPDLLRCSIVWRGSFPVPQGAALDSLLVVGTLTLPGEPLAWPASLEHAAMLVPALPPQGASAGPTASVEATAVIDPAALREGVPGSQQEDGTTELTADQITAALSSQPLPFDGATRQPPPPGKGGGIPGAPWSAEDGSSGSNKKS